MKLRVYLALHKIEHRDFAKKINYSSNHLSLVASENRRAGIKMAKAIEEATNGEVTVRELRKRQEKN